VEGIVNPCCSCLGFASLNDASAIVKISSCYIICPLTEISGAYPGIPLRSIIFSFYTLLLVIIDSIQIDFDRVSSLKRDREHYSAFVKDLITNPWKKIHGDVCNLCLCYRSLSAIVLNGFRFLPVS